MYLLWAQVVAGSNPAAPTNLFIVHQMVMAVAPATRIPAFLLIYPLIYPRPLDSGKQ
jgi:hypothetical protein